MELLALLKHATALLKEHQLEQAVAEAKAARTRQHVVDQSGRADKIHEINKSLVALKRAKEEFAATIERLPPTEIFDAQHRLMPIIDLLFADEILKLRDDKRRASRPAH